MVCLTGNCCKSDAFTIVQIQVERKSVECVGAKIQAAPTTLPLCRLFSLYVPATADSEEAEHQLSEVHLPPSSNSSFPRAGLENREVLHNERSRFSQVQGQVFCVIDGLSQHFVEFART